MSFNLILELIEVNDNVNNYHISTPWYNYWYSFIHEGKKLSANSQIVDRRGWCVLLVV